MKKILALISAVSISLLSHADLFWMGGDGVTGIFDENGVLVPAHETDYTIGYFAQLIYAGPNGVADPLVLSGNGVSGDDVVMATMFCGQNDFLATDGIFQIQPLAAISGPNPNGNFFVRVFNAPNLDFPLGNSAPIPAAATRYFQSEIYTYVHNELLPDLWDFAPGGGATLLVIPEPSVLALLGIGVAALMKHRRRMVA